MCFRFMSMLLVCFVFISVGIKADTGKVIIKSVPLDCQITLCGQEIQKSTAFAALDEIPTGRQNITFMREGETQEAEIEVKTGEVTAVNCHFRQRRIFAQPGVFVGKDGAPMVMIPAGEFQMGSDYGEPDEKPVHNVYLDAFYIDMYEVTNELYKKFIEETGYKTPIYWDDPKCNAPDQPVVGVNWEDAQAYCKWAGKRLPTEAEWEKSARGGLTGKKYPWGDEGETSEVNPEADQGVTGAYPVGSFAPNNYGLYDTARNVWEWCFDWYSADYYSVSPERNPKGPDSGDNRIIRGGSWFASITTPLPVSYRYSYEPDRTSNLIGFRCVMPGSKD